MNTALMFSSTKDDWQTPPELFAALDDEFGFAVDMAANRHNALCAGYFGPDGLEEDGALADFKRALRAMEDGTARRAFWCNPPYSRGQQWRFITKAAMEADWFGHTVVMLLPARTDTKAFHQFVWDAERHQPRPGVEVRFLPGRIRFVGAKHGAPFPSMICIFRGQR